MRNLSEMIEHKYGKCADTAGDKITRWDASIAGVPQPSNETILADIADYEANVLPEKELEQAEKINIDKVSHKFRVTILRAMKQINQSDSSIFTPELKKDLQDLIGFLRSSI